MLLTLVSMAVVMSIWGVLWVVLSGYGMGLAAAFRWTGFGASRAVALPYVGYAAVLGLLQLWHAVRPITTVTLVLLGAGGLACFLARPSRPVWRSTFLPLRSWRQSGPVFVGVAWLANRSLGPNTLWDSGLYHLPFINWATTFAIVPGLGNLHDRLAFNNASLLVHSMLEVTPDLGVSSHLVNGFLCACWVPVVALSVRAILRGDRDQTAVAVFSLAVTVPIVHAASTSWISSTCVEVPVVMLSLVGFRQVLILVTSAESHRASDALDSDVGMALVLFAAAVVVKLSAAFLAMAVTTWLVVLCLRRTIQFPLLRANVRPAIFSLALITVWLVRGVILSGYPAYPSTILGLSVPWRVDPETAAEQRRAIVQTARSPAVPGSPAPEGDGWISRWLVQVVLLRAPVLIALPMLIVAVTGPVLLVTRRARDALTGPVGTLTVPVAAAIAAWFLTAPSARFGAHLWWILAGLMLSLVTEILLDAHPGFQSVALVALAALAFLPILHQMALIELRYRNLPGHRFAGRTAWQELPLLTMTAYPVPLPDVTVKPKRTASGLEVLLPEKGLLCWDAPLLCTTPPSWDPRLRLRHSGRLGDGFSTAPRR